MLNGIDPIIIFQFKKIIPLALFGPPPKIPVASSGTSSFPLPFIPIYLSESLTGIYIDSESKTIDIDTTVEALANGNDPDVNQRPIGSNVKIEMIAKRDSLGLSLLSSLSDLVFPRVTSKEYSITYLHGAIVVLEGLLHSFSITQQSNNDLYSVSLELVRTQGVKLGAPLIVTPKNGTQI